MYNTKQGYKRMNWGSKSEYYNHGFEGNKIAKEFTQYNDINTTYKTSNYIMSATNILKV